MPSKEDMAKAYVEQVKIQLTQLKVQVDALEKHLEECKDELGEENDGDAVPSGTTED